MIETQTVFMPMMYLAQENTGKPPVIGGASDVPAAGQPGAPVTGTAADGSPNTGSNGGGATRSATGGSNMLLFGMLLFFGFLMITTMLQGRKEKKRKAELLNSIARHDRVQTVGGMIGTVVELSDTEAVLRVDESTNSRVRVTRSSIQTVLKKGRGNSIEAEAKPEQAETVS